MVQTTSRVPELLADEYVEGCAPVAAGVTTTKLETSNVSVKNRALKRVIICLFIMFSILSLQIADAFTLLSKDNDSTSRMIFQ